MALLRYEQPWNVMERLHRQIDQILGDNFSAPATNDAGAVAWTPSVDVHEEPDKFIVRADLPGVLPADVSVTADHGVLTLSGHRHPEQRAPRKGLSRLERVDGAFLRRFTLPDNAQIDHIRAHQANGVLEVTIPKVQAPEPRRIAVETH